MGEQKEKVQNGKYTPYKHSGSKQTLESQPKVKITIKTIDSKQPIKARIRKISELSYKMTKLYGTR